MQNKFGFQLISFAASYMFDSKLNILPQTTRPKHPNLHVYSIEVPRALVSDRAKTGNSSCVHLEHKTGERRQENLKMLLILFYV